MMEPIPLSVANAFVEAYSTFKDNRGWCKVRWKDLNNLTYVLGTLVERDGKVAAFFECFYASRQTDEPVVNVAKLVRVSAVYVDRTTQPQPDTWTVLDSDGGLVMTLRTSGDGALSAQDTDGTVLAPVKRDDGTYAVEDGDGTVVIVAVRDGAVDVSADGSDAGLEAAPGIVEYDFVVKGEDNAEFRVNTLADGSAKMSWTDLLVEFTEMKSDLRTLEHAEAENESAVRELQRTVSTKQSWIVTKVVTLPHEAWTEDGTVSVPTEKDYSGYSAITGWCDRESAEAGWESYVVLDGIGSSQMTFSCDRDDRPGTDIRVYVWLIENGSEERQSCLS